MELKGTYEKKDKGIHFDFQLINLTNTVEEVAFSSGQQFEIFIVNGKGEEVYRYSDGSFFTMAMTSKVLKPGEDLKWQETWNCVDKSGEKCTAGNYKATIEVKGMVKEDYEDALTMVTNFTL